MKITEDDLRKLFSEEANTTLKAESKGDSVIVKKVKPTKEIKNIRKFIRRTPKNKKQRIDFELVNSLLRFLAISGFGGFIIFIVLGWGGISSQLKWSYYVDYMGKQIPQEISATPIPSITKTAQPQGIVAPPSELPKFMNTEANILKISKINISPPVKWEIEEENILDSLIGGVAHYKGTSLPGEGGNIFIVGHSSNYFWVKSDFNNIFALLDKLVPGDRIELSTSEIVYVYEVKDTKVVKPNDVQVLENTPKETLTLMTCWPIGTSLQRMLVQSELLYTLNN